MSKWISGFPPSKNGSYLVCRCISRKNPQTIPDYCKHRSEYDCSLGEWIIPQVGVYKDSFLFLTGVATFYWWDEYGIAENKKSLKLNFNTNGNV
jgi:hypothetical protein